MWKPSRGLKICCGITAIFVIILIVTGVVLFLTVFKLKKPVLSTKSVTLEYIKLYPFPFPLHLNVTLGLVVTVNNRNYGSFKYENSTTYVTYRGTPAAQAPIEADTLPARAKHDIDTEVLIIGDNLTTNPFFWQDVNTGCLNFTSSTSLHGKATVLKFLNLKVTTQTICDISLFVKPQNISYACRSKVDI